MHSAQQAYADAPPGDHVIGWRLDRGERSELLLGALRLVLSGGTYVPRSLIDAPPAPAGASIGALTPRQVDVLRLLMRGEPNKQIARELGLTEGTVKIHIAAILRTLEIVSSASGKVQVEDACTEIARHDPDPAYRLDGFEPETTVGPYEVYRFRLAQVPCEA